MLVGPPTGGRRTRRFPNDSEAHPGSAPGCEATHFRARKETPMLRRFLAAFVVLVAFVGLLMAAETKGKITKIDTDKNTITIKVDDKEENFRVGKQAKILNDKGDEIKIGDLKTDSEVTIKWEEVDKNGKKRKQVSEVKVTK
jgi:hypothetical protein